MRTPPLPGALAPVTSDRLATRAVGGRPTQATRPITIDDYDRDRYAAEKRRIAAAHSWDIAEYVNQKAAFIVEILRKAGCSDPRDAESTIGS